jgi:hypothetical protein
MSEDCGCSGGARRKGVHNYYVTSREDNIAQDAEVAQALDGITTTTEECAENPNHIPGMPCASRKVLNALAAFVTEKTIPVTVASSSRQTADVVDTLPAPTTTEGAIVRAAADALECNSESCVITHPSFQQFVTTRPQLAVSRDTLKYELASQFKTSGPRDSLALLSNYNIDETLQRWARVFPEFFPCPFAMIDFDSNGDLFGSVNLASVFEGRVETDLGPGFRSVRRRANCFGCVVNTDTSSGPGKHWVAVFVDARPTNLKIPWTVEYFNSAGNPPPRPMVHWMERMRDELEHYRQGPVITVPVTDMDHQDSQTECGLYALFYIRRRLENTPYDFFYEQRVPDAAMTIFRQHIFRAN